MKSRIIGVSFALLNAILYSAILPLWEGFDEPFHFGYVQHLANGFGLPDPRTTYLSTEIAASFLLAPASEIVQRNIPEVTTYADFFSLPRLERLTVREQLNRIPAELRWKSRTT